MQCFQGSQQAAQKQLSLSLLRQLFDMKRFGNAETPAACDFLLGAVISVKEMDGGCSHFLNITLII